MTERRPPIEITDATPTIHRVLVPGGEVFYVYGCLGTSALLPGLPVPMMVHGREVVAILPLNCIVERWTRDEGYRRDWSIIWSPPAGCPVDSLRDHAYWAAA